MRGVQRWQKELQVADLLDVVLEPGSAHHLGEDPPPDQRIDDEPVRVTATTDTALNKLNDGQFQSESKYRSPSLFRRPGRWDAGFCGGAERLVVLN